MLRDRLRNRWVALGLALGILALMAGGLTWGALQPWTANHFGYALPGKDGLPTYIFARGRRYHSPQVCAGADWCKAQYGNYPVPITRCVPQADLMDRHIWPLAQVGTLFTLFGASRPILSPNGSIGVTAPLVIADGPDCYVEYGLEGGP